MTSNSGAIVSISKGRGQKPLTDFFSRLKRAGVCIHAVATDMAGGYLAPVIKHLLPTQLIFDRFQVVKLTNDKLNTLRREMYCKLKNVQQREELKDVRWLLVKNPENLQKTPRGYQRSRLAEALDLNQLLPQAYYLKDQLRHHWQPSSKTAVATFLNDLCRRAKATGIRVLRTINLTLPVHRTEFLNCYDKTISNSPPECTTRPEQSTPTKNL